MDAGPDFASHSASIATAARLALQDSSDVRDRLVSFPIDAQQLQPLPPRPTTSGRQPRGTGSSCVEPAVSIHDRCVPPARSSHSPDGAFSAAVCCACVWPLL